MNYSSNPNNQIPHHQPGTLKAAPSSPTIAASTYPYFFIHVTYQRHLWLYTDLGRQALREAIIPVRQKHPSSSMHLCCCLTTFTAF
jgi:hypothetical protein